jgi:hypothetical protein
MLPSSHFVPSSEPSALADAKPEALLHALDVFNTATPPGRWVVAGAWDGLPRLVSADALPPAVADDLAIHRASSDVPPRTLAVDELHLFVLDSLEQRLDIPGPNDPVTLHGKLVGPFLGAGPQTVTPGHLKLTRADVLEGLVRSMRSSFLYARSREEGAVSRQCYHLWVGGAPEESLNQGRGGVLVYAMSGMAEDAEPGNEMQVRRLCYDVLAAFQSDLREENDTSAMATATVPVPDLLEHKAELKLQGAKIEGDKLVEAAPEGSSWFRKLFYAMFPTRTPLPPEGDTIRYASLAHLALEALPQWPTSAAQALWARVSTCQVFWTAELADGLRPVSVADGRFEIEDGVLETRDADYKFSVDTKGSLTSAKRNCLGFDVDDRFAVEAAGSVEIEVEYLDAGSEAFVFEYHAEGGLTEAPPIERTGSGTWRSTTFLLTDARFKNDLDGGADFRFCAGPNARDLSLRRVVVRKRIAAE